MSRLANHDLPPIKDLFPAWEGVQVSPHTPQTSPENSPVFREGNYTLKQKRVAATAAVKRPRPALRTAELRDGARDPNARDDSSRDRNLAPLSPLAVIPGVAPLANQGSVPPPASVTLDASHVQQHLSALSTLTSQLESRFSSSREIPPQLLDDALLRLQEIKTIYGEWQTRAQSQAEAENHAQTQHLPNFQNMEEQAVRALTSMNDTRFSFSGMSVPPSPPVKRRREQSWNGIERPDLRRASLSSPLARASISSLTSPLSPKSPLASPPSTAFTPGSFTPTFTPSLSAFAPQSADLADNMCMHCKSRGTPEWRRGPEGERTLCNACGLFYAKLCKRWGEQRARKVMLERRSRGLETDRRVSVEERNEM